MLTKPIDKTLKRNWYFVVIAALMLLLVGASAWALTERQGAEVARQQQGANGTTNALDGEAALEEHGIVALTAEEASNKPVTATELAFIIEEEKLAHDVYQTLYETWGARVFGNIQKSETTHQSMVLTVMESRDLADPRQTEVGVFTNPELQTLYDQLIAQGSQSVEEAYKVGVAIEEKDIADLETIITNLDATDTDIKAVLESLLQGSENHLRAFNRQVDR